MTKAVLVAVDRDGAEPSYLHLFAVTAEDINAAVEAVQRTISAGLRARVAGQVIIQEGAGELGVAPGTIWSL